MIEEAEFEMIPQPANTLSEIGGEVHKVYPSNFPKIVDGKPVYSEQTVFTFVDDGTPPTVID